jgi:nucleoid DNA-binding protein
MVRIVSKMVSKSMAEKINNENSDWSFDTDDVLTICNGFCAFIISETKKGNDVSITNFLKFGRVLRKERVFNNPNKTVGEPSKSYPKPARYAMHVSVMASIKKDFEQIATENVSDDVDEAQESDVEEPVVVKKPVKKEKKPAKAAKAAKAEDSDEQEKPPKDKKVKTSEIVPYESDEEIAEPPKPTKLDMPLKQAKKVKDPSRRPFGQKKEVKEPKVKTAKAAKASKAKKGGDEKEFQLVPEDYDNINEHSD